MFPPNFYRRSLIHCTRYSRSLSTTFSSTLAWERSRLSWLARGVLAPVPDDAHGNASLRSAAAAVDAARAARKRTAEISKPLRIREHNVLAALRDPLRLVEFNRPMPLPAMVDLMILLWSEEAAVVASSTAAQQTQRSTTAHSHSSLSPRSSPATPPTTGTPTR